MKDITLTLKRIDPVKWGIIIGAVYAILSLIIVIPVFLFMSMVGAASGFEGSGVAMGLLGSGVFMLFVPVIYGVLGFLIGLLGAVVFNFVLKQTKGLEMTYETAEEIGS